MYVSTKVTQFILYKLHVTLHTRCPYFMKITLYINSDTQDLCTLPLFALEYIYSLKIVKSVWIYRRSELQSWHIRNILIV